MLANTGARVGEIRTLRWEHIYKTTIGAEERRVLQLKGKTGRRDVAINAGAERYLFRLYDFRTQRTGASSTTKRTCILRTKAVKPIGSVTRKDLIAACEQAGVLYSTDGEKEASTPCATFTPTGASLMGMYRCMSWQIIWGLP